MNIQKYINEINNHISDDLTVNTIISLKKEFLKTKKKNGKVIIVGNGGSASTASHVSIDLTKNAKIKTINFNEANLITCFSNDFGYQFWVEQALKHYCDKKKDFVVILSVSGNSANLIKASNWCKNNKVKYATFTGCSKDNLLRKKNISRSNINFWVNSYSYNIVEIVHHFLLLATVDLIIGKSVYKQNL